jgi:hypothetical protein
MGRGGAPADILAPGNPQSRSGDELRRKRDSPSGLAPGFPSRTGASCSSHFPDVLFPIDSPLIPPLPMAAHTDSLISQTRRPSPAHYLLIDLPALSCPIPSRVVPTPSGLVCVRTVDDLTTLFPAKAGLVRSTCTALIGSTFTRPQSGNKPTATRAAATDPASRRPPAPFVLFPACHRLKETSV